MIVSANNQRVPHCAVCAPTILRSGPHGLHTVTGPSSLSLQLVVASAALLLLLQAPYAVMMLFFFLVDLQDISLQGRRPWVIPLAAVIIPLSSRQPLRFPGHRDNRHRNVFDGQVIPLQPRLLRGHQNHNME